MFEKNDARAEGGGATPDAPWLRFGGSAFARLNSAVEELSREGISLAEIRCEFENVCECQMAAQGTSMASADLRAKLKKATEAPEHIEFPDDFRAATLALLARGSRKPS